MRPSVDGGSTPPRSIALHALFSALSAATPWTTVNPDEMGVYVRMGKVKRVLEPGFYLRWPIIDQIEQRSVVDAVQDMNTQSLVTADLKSIVVSGRLRYRIADIVLAHYETYDLDDVLVQECESAVAVAIMDRTLDQLADREQVEAEVLDFMEERAARWGVDLRDFKITNFTPCKTLRLLQE